MINKKWMAVILIVYTLVIFLPPIMHGATYPNHGQDSYYHLQRIMALSKGEAQALPYWGDYIVGYPLIWLKGIVPIQVSFLWFNFAMLWMVGVSLFCLAKFLFNNKVGAVALMLMFASPSIWNLYDTGALYDLMTVGIILPFLIICAIKLAQREWRYIPHTLLLLFLAVALHSMGIVSVQSGIRAGIVPSEPVPSSFNLMQVIGMPILMLASFLIGFCVREWRNIKLTKKVIIALSLVGLLLLIFLPLSMLDVTGFSFRFALNFAIIVTIGVGCLMGIFMGLEKSRFVSGFMLFNVIVSGVPIMVTYWR